MKMNKQILLFYPCFLLLNSLQGTLLLWWSLGHYFSKKGVYRKVVTEPFCCKIIMHTINNHLTLFQYWHCYYFFQLHPPRHFWSINSQTSPTRLIPLVYYLPSLAGRFFLQTLATQCHRFVSSAALFFLVLNSTGSHFHGLRYL